MYVRTYLYVRMYVPMYVPMFKIGNAHFRLEDILSCIGSLKLNNTNSNVKELYKSLHS